MQGSIRRLAARFRSILGAVLATLFVLSSSVPSRAAAPRVHAIVGARIVTAPGAVIETGNVVMRDGVIVAVGAGAAVPADARVWEGSGLTVYPGLIDPFVLPAESGTPAPRAGGLGAPTPKRERGAGHELPGVRPETRVLDALPLSADQLAGLRGAGFTVAQVAPRNGILRGTSAVIGLGDGSANDNAMRADAAQVMSLEAEATGYPGSLMGAIAVIRQALSDAKWYRDANALYAKSAVGRERPEANVSWAALEPVIAGRQAGLFVASDMLEVLSAAKIAREAGVRAQVLGGGDEYKRAAAIAAAAVPLIVPVNYPEAPDVSDPDLALEVTTEDLRHWDQAPGNAAALVRAGVTFAFTAHGLRDTRGFRGRVARAIDRGLTADQALAAVTTTPAQLLGLSDRLGTIAKGKVANLTVMKGDLFGRRSRLREVWVDGERYEIPFERPFPGHWLVTWGHGEYPLIVSTARDTSVRLVAGGDSLEARLVRLQGARLEFVVQRGEEPPEYFHLTADEDRLTGTLTMGRGSHSVIGRRAESPPRDGAKPSTPQPPVETPVVMGNSEPWRMGVPERPAAVLVKNATVWTAGPQGTLPETDVLFRNGTVAAVGKGLATPGGALVIDGTGKHVAPGIIDAHSHSAIVGNVNECTNNVTAEVRVGDVINSESVNLYRQLAGGTTVMHLLHGSCNAIGGQSAIIKARWGQDPAGLVFAAAPPTIKFALGENPKRANFNAPGAQTRYPQSRGGVEQSIREAFTAARDYGAALDEHKKGKRPYPPRRDLQHEAVLEILQGKRNIHCHSYRQDEILMLMRLAEEFGIRVHTFQHILEGYKVADEMATHGAMASAFTDWWAYKFEVIDAIPYNGYLMWDRGVTVSFNSDSDELARRLNVEAAKAIKYGGVPPEEAIKFVTINPAKQLAVEDRIGSLEPGKDADFSIWNGSPLSPYSRCEQTWIEGRKYFDRAADLAGREALAKEREALIAKARSAGRDMGGGGGGGRAAPRYLFDANMSGNDCSDLHGGMEPFHAESGEDQ